MLQDSLEYLGAHCKTAIVIDITCSLIVYLHSAYLFDV